MERYRWAGWALSAPALLILVGLSIFPTGYLLYNSAFKTTLLSSAYTFGGLENYISVFTNPGLRDNLLVTLLFVGLAVGLQLVFGLLLAVPLSKQTRGSAIASTLLLLPFAIARHLRHVVEAAFRSNFGWIDYYLRASDNRRTDRQFAGTLTSWIVLIALDVWQWTPFVALVLMAGLQSVPTEPHEAAQIDGASNNQIFFHITIP